MMNNARALYNYVKDGHDFNATTVSVNPLGIIQSASIQSFPKMNVRILFAHVYDLVLKDVIPDDTHAAVSKELWDLSRPVKKQQSNSERKEKGKKSSPGTGIHVNQNKLYKGKDIRPSNFKQAPLASLLENLKPKWESSFSQCRYGRCNSSKQGHFTALCFKFHNHYPENALTYVCSILQNGTSDRNVLLTKLSEPIPSHLTPGL